MLTTCQAPDKPTRVPMTQTVTTPPTPAVPIVPSPPVSQSPQGGGVTIVPDVDRTHVDMPRAPRSGGESRFCRKHWWC